MYENTSLKIREENKCTMQEMMIHTNNDGDDETVDENKC